MSNQVIERNLMCSGGPVRIFTPTYVAGLNPEDLNAIAGENGPSSDHRQELRTRIARLEKAKRICAKKITGFEDENPAASEMDYDGD